MGGLVQMDKSTRSMVLKDGEVIIIYTGCGMVVIRDVEEDGHPAFDTLVYDNTGRTNIIRSNDAITLYNEASNTRKHTNQIDDIKFDSASNEFTITTQRTDKPCKINFDDIDWSHLSDTLLSSLKNLKSSLKSLTDKVTHKRIDIDLGNDVTVTIDVINSYEFISDEVVGPSKSIKSFKNYLVAGVVAINDVPLQKSIPLNMGTNTVIISITESDGVCIDYNIEVID